MMILDSGLIFWANLYIMRSKLRCCYFLLAIWVHSI